MARIEKTVFLSYRRTNAPWALAISQYLTSHGYDVFFDFKGIGSGDFESIILENIRARAHFLILLTPSALKRCEEPGDLLRREIETAIDSRRNVIPLLFKGFKFGSKAVVKQLTGGLAPLKSYNGPTVSVEYFDASMQKLRDQFLSVALSEVIHPASPVAREAAKQEQTAVNAAPPVTQQELTAQEWFERGFGATDPDQRIKFYSEAIRLDPSFAEAFNNRGIAHTSKGDLDGAILDFNEAIRLEPDDATAFYNRGIAHQNKGDLDGAISDLSEAIRLNPDDATGFNNRGAVRKEKGDLDGAIQDYHEAIRLNPDHTDAFYNRGAVRKEKGDLDGAIQDYNEAIRLKPDHARAFYNRGIALSDKGDFDGAIQDYSEAIRLNPDHANAHYNRALAWREKVAIDKAIADFQRYLDLGGGERYGDTEKVQQMIRDLQSKL